MPNMSKTKQPMPTLAPETRSGCFSEVALGYTEQSAISEAQRCLLCKHAPCMKGCPVQVKIPDFIKKTANGDFLGAYNTIAETNSLPAICGRVCPQESQCERLCTRGKNGEPVGIGRLERFVADYHSNSVESNSAQPKSSKRVAVVGSGPAGLSCAGDLAKLGYGVTVFEALHLAGGVLVYGIPEFRLPKHIVKSEVDALKQLGVEIVTDTVIGRTITLDELLGEHGYSAVFIGCGAGLPVFMNIPGENLNGVYSANEFLTRINLMKAYESDSSTPLFKGKRVAVVGGGNVAMDSARCARRFGAKVSIVYRRTEAELPARREEVEHAIEEGIELVTLAAPTEILGKDGWVSGIVCQRMRLSDADESGRKRPVPIGGSEFSIEADCVIMAIGTSPNPLIKNTTRGLEVNQRGGIIADSETGQTSLAGVFAGGDAVTGAATVIKAMGAGKKAAAAIDSYIRSM